MKYWIHKRISVLVLAVLSSFYVLAQETKKVDVDINLNKDGGSTWYQQPWVWVVGGAIFILLLVAMLRGGGSKKD